MTEMLEDYLVEGYTLVTFNEEDVLVPEHVESYAEVRDALGAEPGEVVVLLIGLDGALHRFALLEDRIGQGVDGWDFSIGEEYMSFPHDEIPWDQLSDIE